MNRLWIFTPEVVLRGERKNTAEYNTEERYYYESPDGGTRFDDHKVVREIEYTEGEYVINLHIETIENVVVEKEKYRKSTYTKVKYDDSTPRVDRGVFEDIDIINDVKCFNHEDSFPVKFREHVGYGSFEEKVDVPLRFKDGVYYAPVSGGFQVYPVKVFLETNGSLRRDSISSFDNPPYEDEMILVEFINSVKEELGEELI